MKKHFLSLFLFAIVVVPQWLSAQQVSIPSREEEDPKARGEWERKRLADPLTGEIPPTMRARELVFSSTLPSDADGFQKVDSITVPWHQHGPWNIGGRTRAFAIDITDENIMYAGGVSGGLWRTTNAGTTWSRITPSHFHPGTNAIVQDTRPGHTNVWYLLSGEAYGTSASGGDAFYLGTGMFKSSDSGLTWGLLSTTNSGTPQTFDNIWDATWSLAVNTADTVNDMVYASTIGAVMRSTNGGTSWTRVLGSSTSALAYFTNVMCTPNGVLYATLSSDGTSAGIWRSTDGVSWANINPSFMPAVFGRMVSASVPQNENVVYFLAAQTDSAGKLTFDFQGTPEWNSLWRYTYVSGDGSGAGGVWEDLSVNIPDTSQIFGSFNAQGGYDLVVAVKPDDSNMVFIGGTNIFRSTTAFNDSVNTTHIAGYAPNATAPELYNDLYPEQHPDQHVIAFLPSDPDVMISANDGGLYRTNDVSGSPVVWQTLNNGYLVSQFYTIAQDHGTPGSEIIVGGLQDNGTWWTNSATQTNPWKWVAGGDGSYCAIEDGAGTYYFSKQSGRILKCKVDGTGTVIDWERMDPIGNEIGDYQFINPFVLDPNNQNIMYLPAGRKIWRNDDLGGIPFTQTYDSISTNWTLLPDTIPGALSITAISACATPANRIYVGTDNKSIYRIDNANSVNPTMVYVSTTAMPAGYVSCLAVDPTDGDKVIAVFSNYSVYSMWYTTDAGTTWIKCGGNLEQFIGGSGNGPSVRWVSILPLTDGTAYLAATSTGLYGTVVLNGTNTVWTKLSATQLGNSVVDMIDWRANDGRTLIATHGYGVWDATITTTDLVGLNRPQVSEGLKASVFPNPTSSHSTLKIELPRHGRVKIELYDEMGRRIAVIAEEFREAGQYSWPLPVEKLAPGIYYCAVNTSEQSKVCSVIIVR